MTKRGTRGNGREQDRRVLHLAQNFGAEKIPIHGGPGTLGVFNAINVTWTPPIGYPDAPHVPLTVVVNPVVTPLTEEMEEDWEGCLSVPDMRGRVPRYTAVRLQCYDREARRVDLVAKDFFARVIQHETDHLNGIVYVDRMRGLSSLSFLAEWQRYALGIQEQSE